MMLRNADADGKQSRDDADDVREGDGTSFTGQTVFPVVANTNAHT
jgi:hypothetical protein